MEAGIGQFYGLHALFSPYRRTALFQFNSVHSISIQNYSDKYSVNSLRSSFPAYFQVTSHGFNPAISRRSINCCRVAKG
jgi:hypothetical protein